jgi:hypothetical protein
MTALNRNPQNSNLLQPTKFLLTFNRLPNTTYFCQAAGIPSITLDEVDRPSPFLDMYSPGTKLRYDPLDITFLVDEELQSWRNLYDWFLSIADPDGFEKRDHSGGLQTNKHLSDAILTVLNNLNNPILRIQFRNCFPLTMSSIDFNSTLDAESILTCDATFRYESYKYLTV